MTVCFCYRRLREGIFNIKCLAMLKYLSMYIQCVWLFDHILVKFNNDGDLLSHKVS
jgi:hypothetical protein